MLRDGAGIGGGNLDKVCDQLEFAVFLAVDLTVFGDRSSVVVRSISAWTKMMLRSVVSFAGLRGSYEPSPPPPMTELTVPNCPSWYHRMSRSESDF